MMNNLNRKGVKKDDVFIKGEDLNTNASVPEFKRVKRIYWRVYEALGTFIPREHLEKGHLLGIPDDEQQLIKEWFTNDTYRLSSDSDIERITEVPISVIADVLSKKSDRPLDLLSDEIVDGLVVVYNKDLEKQGLI